jgi:hypothetical protein
LTEWLGKGNAEDQIRAMADNPAAKVCSGETCDWPPEGFFLIRFFDAPKGDRIVLTKIARLRILPYIKTISYQSYQY